MFLLPGLGTIASKPEIIAPVFVSHTCIRAEPPNDCVMSSVADASKAASLKTALPRCSSGGASGRSPEYFSSGKAFFARTALSITRAAWSQPARINSAIRVRRFMLVGHAHAIFQHGGAVRRHGNLELRGPGGGLRPLVRRADHAPGAADRLVDFNRHRSRLVVAQRDLVFELVDVRRDLLEVDLLALADDVEGVADLDVQRLVLRRVHDPIFANKLHAALRVLLIHAQHAGRHRNAEAALRLVLELVIHL